MFPGNSDQYTVVAHTLKIPITTRYLRIKPKSWQDTISLRAEFYGCREGILYSPEFILRSSNNSNPLHTSKLDIGNNFDSSIFFSSLFNQYFFQNRNLMDNSITATLLPFEIHKYIKCGIKW